MADVNNIVMTGTVTGEIKIVENEGKPLIATFQITQVKKTKAGDKNLSYKVITFGTTAESVRKNITERDRVYLAGKIDQNEYVPQNGKAVITWQIMALTVDLISKGSPQRMAAGVSMDDDLYDNMYP